MVSPAGDGGAVVSRQEQITALLGAALGLSGGALDEAITLLGGALVIACARGAHPAALLAIVEDSLASARKIAVEHASKAGQS